MAAKECRINYAGLALDNYRLAGPRRNCRDGRYEASIYSKAYTEGSDPFELLI